MHQCSFCKDPIKSFDKPQEAHLVVGMSRDGNIHTHGDIQKKETMRTLLNAASEVIGTTLPEGGVPPKEVTFHNRQRIGDILMFTTAVRDFKKAFPDVRVNVQSTAAHIWDNNPYVDRTLAMPKDKVTKIGPGRGTNQSNRIDWHFANSYRISIEDALGVRFQQGESRPDIWLTEEEYNAPRLTEKPYWIICVNGAKGWGLKMYPFERWQKVVDMNPDLTFVQIGTTEDNPPRLQGKNVIDHVGKTQDKHVGIRELFKLFLNAEGSIGLVSSHMHLSAALYKPAVVVAGAREPVSFTRYPYHQYLATDGTMECSRPACWKCQTEGCTNLVDYPDKLDKRVPKCVDIIEPEEVSAAIQKYYKGGILSKDKPSAKPKEFKNIVKTPDISHENSPLSEPEKKYGLMFGKGAIDPKDWQFIQKVLEKHKVKHVLEFGSGLSTLLMAEKTKVTSYDTDMEWIDKVWRANCEHIKNDNLDIKLWNGVQYDPENLGFVDLTYDLAFVDGPANGVNREQAVRIAANNARVVILHDATREYEKKWEEKYLEPGFVGPIKGGRWCHMWIKTPSFEQFPPPPPRPMNPNKKRIKVVSTARGWGGCARSITTIMQMLVEEGHEVEFIPFRNKVTSREFKEALQNKLLEVQVRESYDYISGECDVLLCYADDYVWEFNTPEMVQAFSNLQAKKKVMMINYRRGGIGEIPWTRGWDRYLALNSKQLSNLSEVDPEIKPEQMAVYPPCTDLTEFFKARPTYGGPLRLIRHNSQGDTKFDKEKTPNEILNALEAREDCQIHMMPGPSFVLPVKDRFFKWPKNQPPIPQFLPKGNLFWYSLPDGYLDMGPRVILEAMAAGLPILADPWGGAVDRVTPECGWICSKEEQLEIIRNVTPEELEAKGEAARKRAHEEFRRERWIVELTGETIKT